MEKNRQVIKKQSKRAHKILRNNRQEGHNRHKNCKGTTGIKSTSIFK
jgi:hypothetical protein